MDGIIYFEHVFLKKAADSILSLATPWGGSGWMVGVQSQMEQ